MPRIRFCSPAGAILADVQAEPGVRLLDLARAHELPLHWRCGQGTCGTCRVQLRHAAQPGWRLLSPKERHVLIRQGVLPATAEGLQQLPDVPEQWRLACHLTLSDEDWVVVLPPPS